MRRRKFSRVLPSLGKRAITEFNYRCADADQAHVYVGIGVKSKEDRLDLVTQLQAKGYQVFDMTENEAAKVHVRHMVGGHRRSPSAEMLFRFEFPERPGALLQFLSGLGSDWNISLFHYRNHGSAWGGCWLVLMQAAKTKKKLQDYLQRIGYRFWSEEENPAYELFRAEV